MQYALIINEQPQEMSKRTGPDAPAYWAAWSAYSAAINEAGVATGGAGLETPDSATTVVLDGSSPTVHDGPYADSKEQLGGFYLIDVPSLDDAIAWAARIPSPGGKIEIRPLISPPESA
ncbi:MAG: YciI family protein [Planctomycetota bacterium]